MTTVIYPLEFFCFPLLKITTCAIFLIVTDVFYFYVHFLPILV